MKEYICSCAIVCLVLIFIPYYRPTGDVTVQKLWKTTEVDKRYSTSETYTVDHFLVSYRYYGMNVENSCEITAGTFKPNQDCDHDCSPGDQIRSSVVYAN